MTIALEHLADGSISDHNFQKLMALVLDTGGQSIGLRIGTGTVTFTTSTTSPVVTVNHGLGKTPVVVFAGPMFAAASTYTGIVITPSHATSTQCSFNGDCRTSLNQSVVFAWVVIG